MGTKIYLGMPPLRVVEWIKNNHGPKLDEPLCFTAVDPGATISFNKVGSPDAANIVTSTDGQTWTAYTFNTMVTLANVGDKVYFRAADENDISFCKQANAYYRFATTTGKKISASGNIQTLMKADGSRLDISEKSNCYEYMFSGCSSLTTAPALPATKLASYCYAYMFEDCTSLTTAPALPATTLADFCYFSMFWNCTSMTTASALPATTLAVNCYNSMFESCTSMTAAPALPAMTLAYGCYSSMFSDCTSLMTAPELPATTLANGCYSWMFRECSSMTTTPALPATALTEGCYSGMFYKCSSLTTAPALPATTLTYDCYGSMFRNCSKLASIDVSFTSWSPMGATTNWVNKTGTTATSQKTFTCPSALPKTTGDDNIPSGWTIITK